MTDTQKLMEQSVPQWNVGATAFFCVVLDLHRSTAETFTSDRAFQTDICCQSHFLRLDDGECWFRLASARWQAQNDDRIAASPSTLHEARVRESHEYILKSLPLTLHGFRRVACQRFQLSSYIRL